MRETLLQAGAPVVAVSPIVGGEVLKGPTASFMDFAGLPVSGAGVAEFYGELLSGMVADETVDGLPTLRTNIRMDDRRAVRAWPRRRSRSPPATSSRN